MNSPGGASDRPEQGCPQEPPILGRFSQLILGAVLPSDRREEFFGDLIEEYSTVMAPRFGTMRARWWLWGQVVRSLAPMLRCRVAKEVEMTKWNAIIAGLILGMGLLQFWDSRVHQSTAVVMALALVAIALPTIAALLFRNPAVYMGATLACATLLLIAKVLSPTPLPALGVVAALSGGMLVSLYGLLTGGHRTAGHGGSLPADQ